MTTKLGQYLVAALVILTLNFLLPRLMPGSPLRFLVGEEVDLLPPEGVRALMAQYGLDRPLWEQFLKYLGQLIRGDLGHSYREGKPVAKVLGERLPWTLLLTGTALVASTALGLVLGAWAAWRHGCPFEVMTLSFFVLLAALPSFFVGMLLIAFFSVRLRWFPILGAQTSWGNFTGWAYALDVLRHLALPTITLILSTTPGVFLVARAAMLGVLGEDYIRTARSKGLRESRVLFVHALRNGLIPVATMFMIQLGLVASGATVVETVFGYPGLGRLLYEAVSRRDYPLMQGGFLLITAGVLLANLGADVLYCLLDPRVRRV